MLELVERYPLAWLVSMGTEGTHTSLVPLLAETGSAGSIDSFLGHLPLSSAHVARLGRDPTALLLFQGPQAYISPRLVSKPQWAPTWNFTVASFDVHVTFQAHETDHALRALVDYMESDHDPPWTVEDMGARYGQLAAHVIAFRAKVLTKAARFKHGQDEAANTFDEIIQRLDDRPLADWMVRTVRGRN